MTLRARHVIDPAAITKIIRGEELRAKGLRITAKRIFNREMTIAVELVDENENLISTLCEAVLLQGNSVSVFKLDEVFKISVCGGE